LEEALNRHREFNTDGSRMSDLETEKNRLKEQASRVADAIAAAGHSPTLLQRLEQIEGMQVDLA
jgi:hypothetical protein